VVGQVSAQCLFHEVPGYVFRSIEDTFFLSSSGGPVEHGAVNLGLGELNIRDAALEDLPQNVDVEVAGEVIPAQIKNAPERDITNKEAVERLIGSEQATVVSINRQHPGRHPLIYCPEQPAALTPKLVRPVFDGPLRTLNESIHRPGRQQASGTILAETHEYEPVENLLGFLEKYRRAESRIYLDEVGIELLPAFAVLSVEPVAQLAGWFQLIEAE
jgi:hypothetical protein